MAGRATETNPVLIGTGVKRAILPAAISELAAKDSYSLRSEVESNHKGDDVISIYTEIDDHCKQNSAYILTILLISFRGAYSSTG